MKNLIILLFFFSFTSFTNAQNLILSLNLEQNNMRGIVNLDTMSHIQFVEVDYKNGRLFSKNKKLHFNLGDDKTWVLLDQTLKPVEAQSWVEVLNILYKYNWIFQTTIPHSGGDTPISNSYIFKRKQ